MTITAAHDRVIDPDDSHPCLVTSYELKESAAVKLKELGTLFWENMTCCMALSTSFVFQEASEVNAPALFAEVDLAKNTKRDLQIEISTAVTKFRGNARFVVNTLVCTLPGNRLAMHALVDGFNSSLYIFDMASEKEYQKQLEDRETETVRLIAANTGVPPAVARLIGFFNRPMALRQLDSTKANQRLNIVNP